MFKVTEGDELDDVPQHRFSFGRAQDPVISIQSLHVGEVCVSHTNDDDGHGQVRGVNDGVPCVGHVCDHTIRQDEEDKVLLRGEGG